MDETQLQTQYSIPSAETIDTLIKDGEFEALRTLLSDVHPADIADILNDLDPVSAVVAFELLNIATASEVLDETGSRVRQELVDKVDDERLADLLDELPMDDAVEFLQDLPDEYADKLIGLMEPEEAKEVRSLLKYEEETAGRLMTRDVVALSRDWTVNETHDFLRSLDDAETLQYLYVVDPHRKLIGVVSLRDFVLAKPQTKIEAIMKSDIASVPVTIDQEELADAMSRYDYFAMPVVDQHGRLLGVVTVDDVIDVLEEEATEDIQRLGGSEPLEQPYFAVSIFTMTRKRVIWLLLLFVASFLSASVIESFTWLTVQFVILGNFIPLITGTGGNAGSQTVSTIIRALATGEVRINDIWRAWWREISTGLLIGALLGLIGFGFVMGAGAIGVWPEATPRVALVVALSLPLVVMWANTTATIVPLVAEKIGIDPAVVSAPMITTIVDATGLMIYFGIAALILL